MTLEDAVDEARDAFVEAMNDDFNTREAMAALLELVTAVNDHTAGEEYDYRALRRAIETFEEFAEGVFGLSFGGDTAGEVRVAEELADLVLSVREREREAGNYERADELRDELEALGITVEDTDDGPVARFND